MWILFEDKTQIIDTSSTERFFIVREPDKSYSVQHYRPGAINFTTLGTYSEESLAITAIGYIFESLDKGETCHAMY